MTHTWTTDNPYLSGSYAPVTEELTGEATLIEGEIPRDLWGVFVRNGPNPKYEPQGRHHWFDGDGMLHAVHLENGKATYRNRYVRTAGLAADEQAQRALWMGIHEPTHENPKGIPYKDTANTDVLFHAGELQALWYICGAPYRVDPVSLETRGINSFGGKRTTSVSAHAKVDPRTGELVFFEYGPRPPYMRYGVVDHTGTQRHAVDISLSGPRLPHDMAITEHYSVLMDLPVFPDPEGLKQRRWRTSFSRDIPARFGVIARHGAAESIRWFDASPCYIYHSVNAWEEGDEIVLVGCRVEDPFPAPLESDGRYGAMMANLRVRARLHEWRFNLKTGACRERALDDRNTEFPSIARARTGVKTRYSYNVDMNIASTLLFDGIVKYDLETGKTQEHAFGAGRFGSESPFAPTAGGKNEDDGYVLSFVHDSREGHSELVILDARDLARGPVARLRLPQRVPLGFHATWVPGEQLNPSGAA
ncbi:MAG: carotenoid oxygenase family protein [Polyangiaceae bacterium]